MINMQTYESANPELDFRTICRFLVSIIGISLTKVPKNVRGPIERMPRKILIPPAITTTKPECKKLFVLLHHGKFYDMSPNSQQRN